MNISPTGSTRTFAILGDPVAQTRSPVLHNAAFAAAKLDAIYTAIRCNAPDAGALILALSRAGGGGNVTIPHKGVAAETVEKPSASVKATRACNTYWGRKGRVYGENTDVLGFTVAVHQLIEDLRGTRALVVGAGGGARAVVYALLEGGCAGVTVLGRSAAREAEIAGVAGRRAKRVAFVTRESLLKDEGYDLIVNATPLGLKDNDRLPLQLNRVGGVTAVMDIVYRSGGTKWVNYARALGLPASDGTEMLLHQAAAAFELWFEMQVPIATMRRALDR